MLPDAASLQEEEAEFGELGWRAAVAGDGQRVAL
jgi:hypothetical protein